MTITNCHIQSRDSRSIIHKPESLALDNNCLAEAFLDALENESTRFTSAISVLSQFRHTGNEKRRCIFALPWLPAAIARSREPRSGLYFVGWRYTGHYCHMPQWDSPFIQIRVTGTPSFRACGDG